MDCDQLSRSSTSRSATTSVSSTMAIFCPAWVLATIRLGRIDQAAIRIGRAIVLIQNPLLLKRARYSRLAMVPTLATRIFDRLDEDVLERRLLGPELLDRQELNELAQDLGSTGPLSEEDLGAAVEGEHLFDTRDLLDS